MKQEGMQDSQKPKKLSEFNKWWDKQEMNSDFTGSNLVSNCMVKLAWDHQQKEIDSLKAQIELMEPVVEFYGDRKNWEVRNQYRNTVIRLEDEYSLDGNYLNVYGGSRACKCKQELAKLRGVE